MKEKQQIQQPKQTQQTKKITIIPETKGVNLYNTNNPIKIDFNELLKKINIMYDEKNDTINIKFNSNLLIESENSIFVSKGDSVFISGDVIGKKGKIYLNPILQRFKKAIKNIKDTFKSEI